MARDSELTLLEQWEHLESVRNQGRRQRADALALLADELGTLRDALASSLESHRREEEQEALAELDCGQMLRDSLLGSRTELEKLRVQLAEQTDQAAKAQERERALVDTIEGDRVAQSLADEAIASLERSLSWTRKELKRTCDELDSVRAELKKADAECTALSLDAARALGTTTEACLENAALKKQIDEQRATLGEQERARGELQERFAKASADLEESSRWRDVAAARLVELQTELETAKRHVEWQDSELRDERVGHEQERNLLRGRLAEEREAHVAKALEAKTLLDQARMRALAAEDETAQLRRQHATTLTELESTRSSLKYADERMKEMSLALDLVRTSREVSSGDHSAAEARRVEQPMTRSSAPPRKSVKRRSLPPRPDQSPGGYSMTEIEIRDEVRPDPADEPAARRRRKP